MTAPLDPDAGEHLSARGGRPLPTCSPEEARARRTRHTQPGIELPGVDDLTLPLPGRELGLRRYLPTTLPPGTVVFFHGGGFVTGDLDTHDGQARMLAVRTGWAVVSVAYRLAPEHPFPAAFDDAVEAVSRFAGGSRPFAVAGSSAGANLAAGAARVLAGEGRAPRAQLLVYPLLDDDPTSHSRREHAAGPGLDEAGLRWYLHHYLGSGGHRDDVRFRPMAAASLAGLPPAIVVAAGHDPLHDDAWAYARALADAGVEVVLHDHPALPHAFWGLSGVVPAARRAAEAACDAFATILRRSDSLREREQWHVSTTSASRGGPRRDGTERHLRDESEDDQLRGRRRVRESSAEDR